MKRYAKALVKELEGLGYEFDRVNSKSMHVYVHPQAPDQQVSPGVDDNTARQILRSVKRALGITEDAAKRKPAAIKARQAEHREHAASEFARLSRERDELIAKRSRLLAGHGGSLTRRQIRDISLLIEDKERERREWERLMTGVPVSAENRGTGQPRHRSGS